MADTASLRDAPERNLAFLFDGDNAQLSLIGDVLAQAVKYGTTTACRIYGDWTTPNMSGWKTALQNHAFQPQQQFGYTSCKNATDSALIIEAMDSCIRAASKRTFASVAGSPIFQRWSNSRG